MSGFNSPKTPSTPATPPQPPSRDRSDSGIQQSAVDDENTTDWTPEIPFENVRHVSFIIGTLTIYFIVE